ncbi:Ferric reductase-like protein [Trachipleistophora hominis]|uniref:Ferric reductase-like protein n=1 Tax=Trachipleistophora hominis TaxID=72359 RepID=L7JUR9_TRAHO|nr:Ferric reductase-like protein [Trachipleistophora hominis]
MISYELFIPYVNSQGDHQKQLNMNIFDFLTPGMNERSESALIIIVIGSIFFLMGGMLFFDRVMMMAGNIVFSIGVLLLLMPQMSLNSSENLKSMSLFVAGIVLVFCGFAVLGFLFQLVSVLYTIRNKIPSFRSIVMNNITKILKFLRIF